MNAITAFTYLISSSIIKTPKPKSLKLSGGGLRSVTKILADEDLEEAKDFLMDNRDEIAKMLNGFIEELKWMKYFLEKNYESDIRDNLLKAKKLRDDLDA